jgi:hypothetical protein
MKSGALLPTCGSSPSVLTIIPRHEISAMDSLVDKEKVG